MTYLILMALCFVLLTADVVLNYKDFVKEDFYLVIALVLAVTFMVPVVGILIALIDFVSWCRVRYQSR